MYNKVSVSSQEDILYWEIEYNKLLYVNRAMPSKENDENLEEMVKIAKDSGYVLYENDGRVKLRTIKEDVEDAKKYL